MFQPATHGNKNRDKYGRGIVEVFRGRMPVGAVVLLPKVARDRGMYLTNNWEEPLRSRRVAYYATRGEALARFGLKARDVR